MIYLASPYSHDDPAVRQARFEAVCRMAARLMRGGLILFSPIAHTHPIALAGDLPKGWDYWEEFDRQFLYACRDLWIAKIPGWKESQGIQAEVVIATQLEKPIIHVPPSSDDLRGLRFE